MKIDKPFSTKGKRLHFIGIGGIGMSSLAKLAISLGYHVSGSDQKSNENISSLQKLGANVTLGHSASNVLGEEDVVLSSAISKDNEELQEAVRLGLKVYKRAELLGRLMQLFKSRVAVSGTHGKTTITAMVGEVLSVAGCLPTVVVGGIANNWKDNLLVGNKDIIVAEADESDGSFLDLTYDIAIVSNIECEHMNFYSSESNLKDYFKKFLEKPAAAGGSIVCIDNPIVAQITQDLSYKATTYGFAAEADYQIRSPKFTSAGSSCEVLIKATSEVWQVKIQSLGVHNLCNAVASLALAHKLNIAKEDILQGLKLFKGVKRRFTKVGAYKGLHIYDDYAHHPTEIEAVLQAAHNGLQGSGKHNTNIIVVLQPHRYSRLKDHFQDYVKVLQGCYKVIVLPVYSAGEEAGPIDSTALVEKLNSHSGNALTLEKPEDLASELLKEVGETLVICMGAGDITKVAYYLPDLLLEQDGKRLHNDVTSPKSPSEGSSDINTKPSMPNLESLKV